MVSLEPRERRALEHLVALRARDSQWPDGPLDEAYYSDHLRKFATNDIDYSEVPELHALANRVVDAYEAALPPESEPCHHHYWR